VAQLATVGPTGRPHIVPVTFVLAGGSLYTAVDAKPKTTTRLQRLRNIRADPRVAVLADHYAEDWDRLWWVRADGTASILDGAHEMAGPRRLLAERYPQYRAMTLEQLPLIVIDADHIASWRWPAP